MRNTKEVRTILSVVYYLNRLSNNEDIEIRKVLEYAFHRLFGGNTNLLLLACIGALPEIWFNCTFYCDDIYGRKIDEQIRRIKKQTGKRI